MGKSGRGHIHPAKKVELHAAAIVDARAVTPGFIEVGRDLRDCLWREVGESGMKVRGNLHYSSAKKLRVLRMLRRTSKTLS